MIGALVPGQCPEIGIYQPTSAGLHPHDWIHKDKHSKFRPYLFTFIGPYFGPIIVRAYADAIVQEPNLGDPKGDNNTLWSLISLSRNEITGAIRDAIRASRNGVRDKTGNVPAGESGILDSGKIMPKFRITGF